MLRLVLNQDFASRNERLSEKVVQSIEATVNELMTDLPEGSISASFVSDVEIRRLNRMYRDQDKITDVLSFSYGSKYVPKTEIGDIAISIDQAKRQMVDNDLELEVSDLLVHGILHVLGYDHEKPEEAKEMFSLQDKIIAHAL